ncbi:hypothetical protein ACFL55_00310 [Candidatus Latescibacterota bacterium]
MRLFRPILKVFVIIIAFSAGSAGAQDNSIGLGFMIGEPTGLSGKVWWDDTMAFDGGVAWSFTDDTELSLHGDAIWHNWRVLMDAFEITRDIQLPLYYGVGGRLTAGDDTRLGIRFVIGVSMIFEDAPFDLFLEAAPIMDVAPETVLRAHAAVGVRFWF